jgi:hypothetical protein
MFQLDTPGVQSGATSNPIVPIPSWSINEMEVIKTEASVIDVKGGFVDDENSPTISKFTDVQLSAVDLEKQSRAAGTVGAPGAVGVSSPTKEDIGYRSSIVVVEPRDDCKSEESEDEVLDLSGSPRFQGAWHGDGDTPG